MEIFITYILPVLCVTVLAALFGLLLSIAEIKFASKKDEQHEKLKNLLPGVNCGGCGFAGCSAFAEALIKGKTDVSKCLVADDKTKNAVKEFMQKEPNSVK